MSNLGKYVDLTVAAKESGGVDEFIADIGSTAVAKYAAPLLLAGAAGYVLVTHGARFTGRQVAKYRMRKERAESVAQQLREATEQNSPGADEEAPETAPPAP